MVRFPLTAIIMSERSKYKRIKMGHLPGDISTGKKAAMLEGKDKSACAKSYKKDFKKTANKKFRHNKEEK